MRKILSNTWALYLVSLAVLTGNYYCSLIIGEPGWFQRSGSIVVLLGVTITARRIIRLGKDHLNEDWNFPDDSPEGKRVLLDERSAYIIGPAVSVLGTIVWGYGDLFF